MIVSVEYTVRLKLVSPNQGRNLLHFFSVTVAGFSLFIIRDQFVLILIGIIFLAATIYGLKNNLFSINKNVNKKNFGILYVPISYLLMVIFLYDYPNVVLISFLILGLADPAAAFFGIRFGKKSFYLTSSKKTYLGSVIFFITTFFLVLIFYLFQIKTLYPNESLIANVEYSFILLFLAFSLILTTVEAFSSIGLDNLFIPITAAVLFYLLFNIKSFDTTQFLIAVFLALIVATISFKLNFLSLNGSAAAFILGSFIFGLGGIKWTVPILTFFILSSIISKIRKKRNLKVETFFDKNDKRDYLQVFANGGIGIFLVILNILNPSEYYYYIYVAIISAVCADTWSTEFGTLKKVNTYSILNFKKIEQGISGGISFLGLMGAIIGALIISLSSLHWINLNPIYFILLIILTGFLGSILDSILGATIQSQYKCYICKNTTEKKIHCGDNAKKVKGFYWMNNDAVNLVSGTISGMIFYIFINFIL